MGRNTIPVRRRKLLCIANTNKKVTMFYKFISDKSTRWFCTVEADNLEEAIEKSKDAEWDHEPDVFEDYHRIEIAESEEAYEDGDYVEDEETVF